MNNYTPHPWQLFFFPIAAFAIGTMGLMQADDAWVKFGKDAYVIGFALIIVIVIALMWDAFIRGVDAIRYLFDSAKHLDSDTIDRLLYAMNLRVRPAVPVETKTTLTVNLQDKNGVTTQTKLYPDIPASPEQLQALAHGLLNGVAFSRRPWSIDRNIFTQDGFSALQKYCLERNLAAPKGNGVEPTDEFKKYLQGCLPSPAPTLETA